MRRSLAKFSESEASNHTPSLADFTTTTPELKFSVHTGSSRLLLSPRPALQTGWLQEPETSDRPRPISRPSELPPSFPRTCKAAGPVFRNFMLRLSMPLISVHDLPAAIRSRSRSSSSGVQRILGITQSFASLELELDQAAHKLNHERYPPRLLGPSPLPDIRRR